MSKSVYFCGTPFHCITAIVLSKENRCESDIIIANNFEGAKEVCSHLRENKIFRRVFFIANYMKGKDWAFRVKVTLSPYYAVRAGGLEGKIEGKYSHIYTNSIDDEFISAVYYFNKSAEIVLFDEGYGSYLPEYFNPIKDFSFSHKIVRGISKAIFKRKYIDCSIKEILLYAPELLTYSPPCAYRKINVKNHDVQVGQAVNQAFAAERHKNEYDYEYIFFEESYANDYGDNRDLEYVDLVASIVGKEKLLIKLHPRDTKDRFSSKGYHTSKSFGVPWEVMALFADKVKCLITFSSGAALSYRFIFQDNKYETILLYRMEKDFARMSDVKQEFFEKYMKYYGSDFMLPGNRQELLECLKGAEKKREESK